jgi:ACS family hexuronate transporter-like MFS transporter
VAGFVWVAVWLLFYRSPEQHPLVSKAEFALIRSGSDSAAEENTTPIPWIELIRLPQSWSFFTSKFLTDPVWFFLLFWLPDYFKKTRHLDIKSSWPHLMTVYALVTVISLCGGYFPGYLLKRGWSVTRARKTALFIYALLVLPILAIGTAGDWIAVLLIGLVGGAHQSWSANLFTTVSDMFPRKAIGTLIGIGSMTGAVGSMLFQFFCGHILDLYGPEHANAGYFLLFAYAASAYLIAFGLNNLLAPSYKPLDLDAK